MSLFTQSMSVTGSAINTASPWVIVGDDRGALLNVTRSTHNLEYKVQYSLADPNRTTATAYTYATVTSGDSNLVNSVRVPPPVAAVRVLVDGVSAADGGGTGTLSVQGMCYSAESGSADEITETADRLFMTAAERTTVGSFRNVMTFPGVQAAVDAGTAATAAIQAAIDACAPLSIPLFFPAGTYRVDTLQLRAGSRIKGSGRISVLKLVDGATDWHTVLRAGTNGTSSGVDNVLVEDICLDGNQASIGLVDNQMAGIMVIGRHDNIELRSVHCQNTCGDGIFLTGATTHWPTNVRIIGCTQSNTFRQDIAIVSVDGCSVIGCSGDGTFDIEANISGEVCKNISVTNIIYNKINCITYNAANGATEIDGISMSQATSATSFQITGVGGGVFTSLIAGTEVWISDCYKCTFDGITAATLQMGAPNGQNSRLCAIRNANIVGGAPTYGVLLSNTFGCSITNADVAVATASGDGIRIQNYSDPGANTTTLSGVTIHTHQRYGVYVVNAASLANCTYKFDRLEIRTAGTNPILYDSGLTALYGTVVITNSEVNGTMSLLRPKKVVMRDVTITGDSHLYLRYGTGKSIDIDRIFFERATVGTPTVSFASCADIAALRVGLLEQPFGGSVTCDFTGATFAAAVKAWISGPVQEATTWASTLADANIREGSMYRLRGNATNWGYTHNGTAWVAKAH